MSGVKPQWHLNKEEVAKVIRKLRADNPDANGRSIYQALLAEQKRKQEETETKFARNLLTGELLSINYFEGRVTSVERADEIPPAFLEAFNNRHTGGK